MIFDVYFEQLKQIGQAVELQKASRVYQYDEALAWPRGEAQIIFNTDTAVELGGPKSESTSFIIWTDDGNQVKNGQITLIGPELNECGQAQLSFGKIVTVQVHGFTDENAYERYQEMNIQKFKNNLEGYMLRAVPQENKEWSRVSQKAIQAGFSLQRLGNELIRDLLALEYVDGVEIIFITSSKDDVLKFKPIGEKAAKVTAAMNKMFENLEFDCASCNFADVCKEVDGLREMHQKNL